MNYLIKLEQANQALIGNNVPYDFVCPQCMTLNNMNCDGYQMNDIVEQVFCSVECSYQFNLDHKEEFIEQGYTMQDLEELA